MNCGLTRHRGMHLIWTQIEGEGKDVMREELAGGGGEIQMEHSEGGKHLYPLCLPLQLPWFKCVLS